MKQRIIIDGIIKEVRTNVLKQVISHWRLVLMSLKQTSRRIWIFVMNLRRISFQIVLTWIEFEKRTSALSNKLFRLKLLYERLNPKTIVISLTHTSKLSRKSLGAYNTRSISSSNRWRQWLKLNKVTSIDCKQRLMGIEAQSMIWLTEWKSTILKLNNSRQDLMSLMSKMSRLTMKWQEFQKWEVSRLKSISRLQKHLQSTSSETQLWTRAELQSWKAVIFGTSTEELMTILKDRFDQEVQWKCPSLLQLVNQLRSWTIRRQIDLMKLRLVLTRAEFSK